MKITKKEKTQNLPDWIGLPEYIVVAKGYFMLKYTWVYSPDLSHTIQKRSQISMELPAFGEHSILRTTVKNGPLYLVVWRSYSPRGESSKTEKV